MQTADEVVVARTLGEAFTKSASYQWNREQGHRSALGYTVEMRKAAGDPVDLQSVETGPQKPLGDSICLCDYIFQVPITSGAVSIATWVPGAPGAGSAVLHGAVKPALGGAVSTAILPVQSIAGWLRMSTQMLDDVASAEAFINWRLEVSIDLAEENEVLNGSGVDPHLKGFASVTGIPTAGSILAGVATVRQAGFQPSLVVVAAGDSPTIITDAGNGYFAGFGTETLFGVPVYHSAYKAAGTALVGDFQRGCAIYRRAEYLAHVGNQFDGLTKNLITIVGESRLAFAVSDPEAFCLATV